VPISGSCNGHVGTKHFFDCKPSPIIKHQTILTDMTNKIVAVEKDQPRYMVGIQEKMNMQKKERLKYEAQKVVKQEFMQSIQDQHDFDLMIPIPSRGLLKQNIT
jgi:hypothetical protein